MWIRAQYFLARPSEAYTKAEYVRTETLCWHLKFYAWIGFKPESQDWYAARVTTKPPTIGQNCWWNIPILTDNIFSLGAIIYKLGQDSKQHTDTNTEFVGQVKTSNLMLNELTVAKSELVKLFISLLKVI
jgi:hypothetical protein